jgi:hypothetical protein
MIIIFTDIGVCDQKMPEFTAVNYVLEHVLKVTKHIVFNTDSNGFCFNFYCSFLGCLHSANLYALVMRVEDKRFFSS